MAKRVAIYLRVSTEGQNTDLQRQELGNYVKARGWEIASIYEDKATGTNTNRPMIKAMLKDARMRRFDGIAVWKLDRFARSLKDLVTMLQELSEIGIEFISLRDNIDLTTSTGRLMMHMIGAFAEFEASLIRERVIAGQRLARSKGKHMGRPASIDRTKVLSLRAAGLSLGQIAKTLSVTKSAVSKVLKNAAQKSLTNQYSQESFSESLNSFQS